VLALLWVLRLGDLINGWTFLGCSVAAGVALRIWATARQTAAPTEPEVPVEWWGLRRAWRPEDREVLARGLAAD
jgi:branched-chain amino acid transport system permease protein